MPQEVRVWLEKKKNKLLRAVFVLRFSVRAVCCSPGQQLLNTWQSSCWVIKNMIYTVAGSTHLTDKALALSSVVGNTHEHTHSQTHSGSVTIRPTYHTLFSLFCGNRFLQGEDLLQSCLYKDNLLVKEVIMHDERTWYSRGGVSIYLYNLVHLLGFLREILCWYWQFPNKEEADVYSIETNWDSQEVWLGVRRASSLTFVSKLS